MTSTSPSSNAAPSRFKVLIVDDEKTICDFLKEALDEEYDVTVCYTGKAACHHIADTRYDILVLDLRLPDLNGLEILKFAKQKDEYAEVIIITGYASLDSAAWAINAGAASYLIKPLMLEEFCRQMERVAANRAFHLKSIRLMEESHTMEPEIKGHLQNLTSLYQFSRKLLLSLQLPDLIGIIIDDILARTDAPLCCLAVNFLDFSEVYFGTRHGEIREQLARELLDAHWEEHFALLDRRAFDDNNLPVHIFPGTKKRYRHATATTPYSIPMSIKGKTIGTLVLFRNRPIIPGSEEQQFLFVYVSLISSILEHAVRDMRAQLMAKTDSLTGIANYRLFQESLMREIARADRKSSQFGIILMDLDNFKSVNDSFGHPAGNDVLRELVDRVAGLVRRGDLLARYGGEEFVLLLPDSNSDGALSLAERIRDAVAAKPFRPHAKPITVTLSLGVAIYSGTKPMGSELIVAKADKALYASKREGKNRVSFAD